MALFYFSCEKDWLSYENKRLCFIPAVRRAGSDMRINGSVLVQFSEEMAQFYSSSCEEMAVFYFGCEKDWLNYENKRLCFIPAVRRTDSVMRINGSVLFRL